MCVIQQRWLANGIELRGEHSSDQVNGRLSRRLKKRSSVAGGEDNEIGGVYSYLLVPLCPHSLAYFRSLHQRFSHGSVGGDGC